MSKSVIDWLEILNNMNTERQRKKLPTFSNLKAMLTGLYWEDKLDAWQMAEMFWWKAQPSRQTVWSKMIDLGVKTRGPGVNNKGGNKALKSLHPEKHGFKTEEEMLRQWRIKEELTGWAILERLKTTGTVIHYSTLLCRLKRYGIRLSPEKKRERQLGNLKNARSKCKAAKDTGIRPRQ